MWRRLSLLILCCALSGPDAYEAGNSADSKQETMLLAGAADLGKPDNEAPTAVKAEDGVRGGELQSPRGDAPVVGLFQQDSTAEPQVEFAVDESGLWLLYPALDTEGFHQEVILLVHLHPRDLQPIRSFRTGLRLGRYGNSFLVCGVLYAVDSMDRHYANVTYAFDTHTLTHTVPSLAFTNMHAHTSQLAYCPLDKKLYAWDNGHQMMYDVVFAY